MLANDRHEQGCHQARIDATSLARGIHVLRLESKGSAATTKLIVE
jgi:hypothetical protein